MVPGPTDRRLVLLRHATADGGEPDHLRPLALAGRRQAPEVGGLLARAGWQPDRVLVSSAVRTQQTWELVRASLGQEVTDVEVTEALYAAGQQRVLELVRAVPGTVRTLLVVGHEPAMSGTAAVLADLDSDPAAVAQVRAGLPTAAFAVLTVHRDWAGLRPGGARLDTVARPD